MYHHKSEISFPPLASDPKLHPIGVNFKDTLADNPIGVNFEDTLAISSLRSTFSA